jgi:hypothetical protein
MKHLNRTSIIIGAGLMLAVLTLVALGFMRIFYSVVSGQPSISERAFALVGWLSAVGIYFVVIPVMFTLLRKNPIKVSWPVHEVFLFVMIILAVTEFNVFNKVFPSDVVLIAFCYLLFTIIYIVSFARAANAMRARSWRHLIAASMAATFSGSVIFFVIWAILYFE